MWALKNFHRCFIRSASSLQNRFLCSQNICLMTKSYNKIQSKSVCETKLSPISLVGSLNGLRWMSTTKGRSMRSKVEKRMRRETGKTLREVRRAKKLRKKLMTDEERLIYNLRRAKKKVALLLQKLKKYELPELPPPRHDPELLTSEQLQAYKKIGFRNRNYVPVGVRGVFGGVVQNMHLHWKFHETVQVCCDNFPKEKIREMATMLARLSGGIVVNVHNVKTIIMFRGRNYRQPKNLIPINTLTKRKALFKARFEQALESQKLNIKKIEQQLRRKGVNPEDPVAMASIQRVASTFFRAIDEKQGTPYVFRGDRQPLPETDDIQEEAPTVPSEDSDQEELDRFIAEIEDAADKEWEAEEAAEKEEMSRIRYWGRDDIGPRGRSLSWTGDRSEEEGRGRGRGWDAGSSRQRTMEIRKWDSGDDISEASEGEEWDSEDERGNSVDAIGGGFNNEVDANEIMASSRQKSDRGGPMEAFKARNGNLRGRDAEVDTGPEDDMFGDSEDEFWGKNDEKEHTSMVQPGDLYNYYSCEDEDSDGNAASRDRMFKSKSKKMDENWDSD